MQQNKKILFVGPITPPLTGQSLAFTRFVEACDINDKDIINISTEYSNKLHKIYFSLLSCFHIFRKVTFGDYDGVYFTCSRSLLGSIRDVVLINMSSLKGLRIINHLHGSDFYDFLHSSSPVYKKILFISYNKVHTSIVLLDRMKMQFQDFPQMKIETVSNFFDKEIQENIVIDEEAYESDGRVKILYLSNVMASKGVFDLIDAFNIICTRLRYVDLYIAGDYFDDDLMDSQSVKEKFELLLSENSNIHYFGTVFGENKVKLLNESDIFVLPSYYKSEAFPISIIEAMASKNAIVTTNYRYLPDVVGYQSGVIVNPRSPSELAEGIESLVSDNAKLRAMQDFNAHHASENYALSKYLQRLSDIVF